MIRESVSTSSRLKVSPWKKPFFGSGMSGAPDAAFESDVDARCSSRRIALMICYYQSKTYTSMSSHFRSSLSCTNFAPYCSSPLHTNSCRYHNLAARSPCEAKQQIYPKALTLPNTPVTSGIVLYSAKFARNTDAPSPLFHMQNIFGSPPPSCDRDGCRTRQSPCMQASRDRPVRVNKDVDGVHFATMFSSFLFPKPEISYLSYILYSDEKKTSVAPLRQSGLSSSKLTR